MKRATFSTFAGAMAAMLAAPAAARAPVGPEAAACQTGGPAILVNVTGFRHQTGKIRVQLHSAGADTWLKKPGYAKRIEVPVTAAVMPVCLKVPGPGNYAIAVRHDEDGDGRMTRHDGGGYSNNPDLSITHLQPSYQEAMFKAGSGVTPIKVVMNYLYGLSIHPVR